MPKLINKDPKYLVPEEHWEMYVTCPCGSESKIHVKVGEPTEPCDCGRTFRGQYSFFDKKLTMLQPEAKLLGGVTYNERPNDNTKEVYDLIKSVQPLYVCPDCQGSGEYEGEHGAIGCMPCNSRLIYFTDYTGKVVSIDWGDSIVHRTDGLHRNRNYKYA